MGNIISCPCNASPQDDDDDAYNPDSQAAEAEAKEVPRKENEYLEYNDWPQIEQQQEAESVRLALLLQRLKTIIAKKQGQSGPAQNVNAVLENIKFKKVDGGDVFDHLISGTSKDDFHITPAVAEEFGHALCEGKEILPDAADTLCEMAVAVMDKEPNVVRLPRPEHGCNLTVVGDLHGNFDDLIRIFDRTGWPSATNQYIFVGDYVDKGLKQCHLIWLLLAYKVALPKCITLLRGNHEDGTLCTDFKRECLAGYNEYIHHKITAAGGVFTKLPLCAVVEGVCYVVHAGLIRRQEATLEDINAIDRKACHTIMQRPPDADDPQHAWDLWDLCWSDPKRLSDSETSLDPALDNWPEGGPDTKDYMLPKKIGTIIQHGQPVTTYEYGKAVNVARCGEGYVSFYGKNMVKDWLDKIGVGTMVRGHEIFAAMKDTGYCSWDIPGGKQLYSLMSACNQAGCSNHGAVLHWHWEGATLAKEVVSYYAPLSAEESLWCHESLGAREIHDALLQGLPGFTAAYEELLKTRGDDDETVTPEEWVQIVSQGLNLATAVLRDIQLALCPVEEPGGHINFRDFLDSFHSARVQESNAEQLSLLYKNLEALNPIFNYLDKDHDGYVTREEWTEGCRDLIAELGPAEQDSLKGVEGLFDLIDLDGNGGVSVHEFLEGARLSERDRMNKLVQTFAVPTTPGELERTHSDFSGQTASGSTKPTVMRKMQRTQTL